MEVMIVLAEPPVPPFDSELEGVLVEIEGSVPRLRSEGGVSAYRAQESALPLPPIPGALQHHVTVRADAVPRRADAPEVPVIVVAPVEQQQYAPLILAMHGGGLVAGTHEFIPDEMFEWTAQLGVVVVSVGYRLAPEHPYPRGLEDCYAALSWACGRAQNLGIDTSRVVIVGASAGGGLAAALALLARDRGGPAVMGQMLLGPMLDDRNETASALQMRGRGVWDRDENAIAWRQYLADLATERVPSYAAAGRATDLSGLPAAFIDVGSAETFRDEAIAYAQGMWRDGGAADLHVFAGGFHGYDVLAPSSRLARETAAARLGWLSRRLRL